jgi:hypothetical protein
MKRIFVRLQYPWMCRLRLHQRCLTLPHPLCCQHGKQASLLHIYGIYFNCTSFQDLFVFMVPVRLWLPQTQVVGVYLETEYTLPNFNDKLLTQRLGS